MKLVWGAASHVGMLRQQNEDAYVAEERVFVVADGMGGHNAGEVASALAVAGMRSAAARGFVSAESVVTAVNDANRTIHEDAGRPIGIRSVRRSSRMRSACEAGCGDEAMYAPSIV